MTIYSLDVLIFLFGTSLLFHVQFELLLPDLHTDFSRGRSGGLLFPSLSEFSTVYWAPHSSTLAWKIPRTKEPGRRQSIESWRDGHGNFTFTFLFHALEKEMATHTSILAWRIPGTEEPGGLPSMGSHRVRHNWSNFSHRSSSSTPTQCPPQV